MSPVISNILVGWVKALVETIIIEGVFAFALGVKLREQPIVLLANVATNPFLNALLTLSYIFLPFTFYYPLLALLEVVIVFAEGVIYKKAKVGKINPFLLSFLLNAMSYGLGTLLNHLVK